MLEQSKIAHFCSLLVQPFRQIIKISSQSVKIERLHGNTIFFFYFRDLSDPLAESKSSSSLGLVHHKMGDFSTALNYHTRDLEISDASNDPAGQARALGNIGAAYEGMGELEKAIGYFEQLLSIANGMNNPPAKTQALGSLGNKTFFRKLPNKLLTDAPISFRSIATQPRESDGLYRLPPTGSDPFRADFES